MNLKLISKRECWCLTTKGRLLVVFAFLLSVLLGARYGASFLNVNQPVPAEVLIVEGWLPEYALRGAKEEFDKGKYRFVITSGSPLSDGYYYSDYKTYADWAALTLIRLGMASNSVVPVPAPLVLRDRTLEHARAVKKWLDAHAPEVKSVNVYSLGAHARRSRLVFRRVMGSGVAVGAVAHPDARYDVRRWWATSEGFRSVSEEALAYCWTCMHGLR